MLKGLAICLELHYVTFVLTDARETLIYQSQPSSLTQLRPL
ncbi:hypothetical protein RSUY_11540 [Ralstonia solanacearum]|nr:hypothetical protein RSUY_11540 [Ralstonia solanacearum]